MSIHKSPIATFGKSEEGAALVEFALLLPMCLLMFAMAIEGSRTFWAYQSVISGVRDASRFVSRSASSELCNGSGSLNSYDDKVTEIVAKTVDGTDFFPSSIVVSDVTPTLSCVSGNFAMGIVPVVNITATLDIDYPFSGIFRLIGLDLGNVSTVVTDRSRIYGV